MWEVQYSEVMLDTRTVQLCCAECTYFGLGGCGMRAPKQDGQLGCHNTSQQCRFEPHFVGSLYALCVCPYKKNGVFFHFFESSFFCAELLFNHIKSFLSSFPNNIFIVCQGQQVYTLYPPPFVSQHKPPVKSSAYHNFASNL